MTMLFDPQVKGTRAAWWKLKLKDNGYQITNFINDGGKDLTYMETGSRVHDRGDTYSINLLVSMISVYSS